MIQNGKTTFCPKFITSGVNMHYPDFQGRLWVNRVKLHFTSLIANLALDPLSPKSHKPCFNKTCVMTDAFLVAMIIMILWAIKFMSTEMGTLTASAGFDTPGIPAGWKLLASLI